MNTWKTGANNECEMIGRLGGSIQCKRCTNCKVNRLVTDKTPENSYQGYKEKYHPYIQLE